ncbi:MULTISPECIES: isoprenylcysteine carboxylmethyltransferase family protein [unclassified Phyllobacterium]|uniref:methyltransferase family protein n=1 Tax=Phyllobacterium TaxID=28100 RepID=UPI000DDC0EB3|nr:MULTISPECIES: isoprenylcysteine carboxylmethyltransferase family protein [unclassified Phyllobacterium]MBA8899750.1 protein-S-isoprenylcysteine O-methyltransferase Ste14 [Phyllobacterium sp. P30BS-XVII]UGX85737.1 isoprenylcysteine carboxylmethyltransferase family protein [Phyllobacterium sp. T1293]
MTLTSPKDMARFQSRRRLALAIVILLILAALLTVRSAWTDGWTHEYIEDFGIGVIVLAILGRMWCTLYIGGRKSSEIVRLGPYSMSRNPLYVFSTLGAFGIGMMTGSLTVAFLLAVLCYIAFYFVIVAEEGYLESVFGETYLAYKREVPRFFPNIRLYREAEVLSVKSSMLYKTLADGLVFFISYPLLEFVEYLQSANILPILFRLY